MTRYMILVLVILSLASCADLSTAAPATTATQTIVETAAVSPGSIEASPIMSPSSFAPTFTPEATGSPPSPAPTHTPRPTPTPGSAGIDEVIAFNPGPGAQSQYLDPEAVLGEPDLVETPCCQGMVQLGKRGTLLLAFTDNVIVDGDGPDFEVYGESAKDDYLLIEISADGRTWCAYPKTSESSGGLDLADVGLTQAVYVRLTDWQPATPTGAEIDAVIALHSASKVESDLPPLPDAVARTDLTLYEGGSVIT